MLRPPTLPHPIPDLRTCSIHGMEVRHHPSPPRPSLVLFDRLLSQEVFLVPLRGFTVLLSLPLQVTLLVLPPALLIGNLSMTERESIGGWSLSARNRVYIVAGKQTSNEYTIIFTQYPITERRPVKTPGMHLRSSCMSAAMALKKRDNFSSTSLLPTIFAASVAQITLLANPLVSRLCFSFQMMLSGTLYRGVQTLEYMRAGKYFMLKL